MSIVNTHKQQRLKNCLEQFSTSAQRGWSMDAPDKKLPGAIFHVSPKGLTPDAPDKI